MHAAKRGKFTSLPTKTDPRENKHWKYFMEAQSNFTKDTMFDPYIFVEAQFRNLTKEQSIFPAQLKTKAAIERYNEHRESLRMRDNTSNAKAIMQNLASTFKLMKKWWKQNNLPIDSYREFFTPKEGEMLSEGMLFCIQNMISKYFMAVSRHFDLEYSKLDSDMKLEIIDPLELKSFRMKLIMEDEAYLFAKQTFKSEIT